MSVAAAEQKDHLPRMSGESLSGTIFIDESYVDTPDYSLMGSMANPNGKVIIYQVAEMGTGLAFDLRDLLRRIHSLGLTNTDMITQTWDPEPAWIDRILAERIESIIDERLQTWIDPSVSNDLPEEILTRLDHIAALPENWDGEGATRVARGTIDLIKTLLRKAYAVAGKDLPVPSISPAHDGMLVAEWTTNGGKELILDVPPDDSPGFLLVEPQPSGDEVETDAEIGDEWPIERLIHQLLAS